MAKTSFELDAQTAADIENFAQADGLNKSAYVAALVRRDRRQRGLAQDTKTLQAAGHTPERASALAARLIAAQRAS